MCDLTELKVQSPVGVWDVHFCPSGLHWVKLEKGQNQDINLNYNVEVVEGIISFHPFLKWLSVYFKNVCALKSEKVPEVCPAVFIGGGFREKVWQEIYTKLEVGQTATYGEVAAGCGSVGASQAVGTAMKTNPVSLVIPCHRVVKAGGKPGHYSGGTRDYLKIWLLDHEKQVSQGMG